MIMKICHGCMTGRMFDQEQPKDPDSIDDEIRKVNDPRLTFSARPKTMTDWSLQVEEGITADVNAVDDSQPIKKQAFRVATVARPSFERSTHGLATVATPIAQGRTPFTVLR
jgi:hypothetical protein